MDKTQGSTAADWLEGIGVIHDPAELMPHPTELMPPDFEDRASFSATLPFTQSALRFHGDCGARVTFEVADTDADELKKLIDWRKKVLRVTVRPIG